MIYNEFYTWRKATEYRFATFIEGLYGVVFLCLIMGMVSVLYHVIRKVNAFYRRETSAACIVTAIILFITYGWVVTFVNERYLRVEAQHRADSIAYELSKYTQIYDKEETIVFGKDTVSLCK